jgi:hypothetical protein
MTAIPARLPWSPGALGDAPAAARTRGRGRAVLNTLYDCPKCGREVRRAFASGSDCAVLLVADPRGGYYVDRGRVQALGLVAFGPGDVPQRYALHRVACRAGEDG